MITTPNATAGFVAAMVMALPASANALSAPAAKSIPGNVLLSYYSRAPGVGELVVRFDGRGKVVHSRHRVRFFRLGAADLSVLRQRLRHTPEGFVHGPDRHVRDAIFQLRRPRKLDRFFTRVYTRELLASGSRRFAGRRPPEASVAQKHLLSYLDGIARSQSKCGLDRKSRDSRAVKGSAALARPVVMSAAFVLSVLGAPPHAYGRCPR